MTRNIETGSVRPLGALQEVLEKYDAPPNAQRSITRRAGALSGSKAFPTGAIADIIEASMFSNGGLADWSAINRTVGATARDAYKKLKR